MVLACHFTSLLLSFANEARQAQYLPIRCTDVTKEQLHNVFPDCQYKPSLQDSRSGPAEDLQDALNQDRTFRLLTKKEENKRLPSLPQKNRRSLCRTRRKRLINSFGHRASVHTVKIDDFENVACGEGKSVRLRDDIRYPQSSGGR